jgi:hypothetical protein
MVPAFRRTLIGLGVIALATVVGGPVAAAPSPAPGPVATIVVRLPQGASLPAGTYQVTVRGTGSPVTGVGSVAPPAARPEADRRGVLLALLGVLLVGVMVAGAVLLGRGPVRRRREFQRLAALVGRQEYAEAVAGLSRLEGQLTGAQRAEARFCIAFSLYQLGDLDEAEHRLATLHREDPDDPEVAYLLAYLRVRRRDFDGAEPALAGLARRGRLDVGAARRLYGIVTFQRAARAVSDGRITEAAQLFELVEQLGDFADEVPADLRNRHAVLGARALLDGDLEAARAQFDELNAAAHGDDLRVPALLGLALTHWRAHEPGSAAEVHKLVTGCLRLLDPGGPLALPWPRPPGDTVEDRLRAVRAATPASADEADRRNTLRDLHLLRALAVVRAVAEAERPGADPQRLLSGATERLACVVKLDPTMADPYLIVGLLRYHLAADPAATRVAVQELRAARTLGARDPVLLRILHQHDRKDQARQAAWQRFTDSGAAEMMRVARFGRVPTLDSSADALSSQGPPTVAELRDRADLLAARLRGLDDGADAVTLAGRLEERSTALGEQLRMFEQIEADALAHFGDRLLGEVDGGVDDGGGVGGGKEAGS